MKRSKVFAFLIMLFFASTSFAQLFVPFGTGTFQTEYPGTDQDPVYVFCANATNDTAGILGCNANNAACTFLWGKYNPTTQLFDTIDDGWGTVDSITNLETGFYQVIVDCPNGKNCYRAHILVNRTAVEMDPIDPGCEPFTITGGFIDAIEDFTIYEPPASPFIVDSLTQIEVCFSGSHTYVSDLGFYLVAPDGNTTVELLPSIAAWNTGITSLPGSVLGCDSLLIGTSCNNGNNFNDFCFSTGPIVGGSPTLTPGDPNLTACVGDHTTFPPQQDPYPQGWTLEGTFASAGPWSPLWTGGNQFNAAQGGWQVMVYDCIGADVGYLGEVTITFKGEGNCGTSTVTYNSGPINVTINDGACDPNTASVYTVPLQYPITYVIEDSVNARWTVSPPYTGVGATANGWNTAWGPEEFHLNPQPYIDPIPLQTSTFCLKVNDLLFDTLGNLITGYTSCKPQKCKQFVTLPTDATVSWWPQSVCKTDPPVALIPLYYSGSWDYVSGPGNANTCITSGGYFIPGNAEVGTHELVYEFPQSVCYDSSHIFIDVVDAPIVTNIQEQCAPDNSYFIVSFTITQGNVAGYTVTDTLGQPAGNLMGTQFQDTIFATGGNPTVASDYAYIIDDNNHCEPVKVTGYKGCDCSSFSGFMSQTSIVICPLDYAQSLADGSQFLDGNDTIQYILHTGQFGTIIGSDIIGYSNEGKFYFQAGVMNYDQWYYISAIVGNELLGTVDKNDGCLSVAQGTPVKWMEQPIANAGLDMEVCGKVITLNADTSGMPGVAQWNANQGMNWLPTGVFDIPDATVELPNFSTDVNGTLLNTLVTFTWTVENGPCTSTDNMKVLFKPIPTAFAGNDTSVCGLTVNLNAEYSLGGPPLSFGSWSPSGFSSPTPTITVNNYGSYTYVWRENNEDCFDQDYVTIDFIQTPYVDANHNDSVCGQEYYLNAISTMGTGTWTGPPGSNFVDPATPSVNGSGVNIPNAIVLQTYSPPGASTFTATYTWTEENQFCDASDNVSITFSEPPQAFAGPDDEVCGNIYEFSALATGVNYNEASWSTTLLVANYDDDADPEAEVTIPNTGSMPNDPQAGSFGDSSYVTVPFIWNIEYNKCSRQDTVLITFYQIPDATAGPDDTICGLEYDFSAEYSIGNSNGQWTMVSGTGTANWQGGDNANPEAHVTVTEEGVKAFRWVEYNAEKPSCNTDDTVYINFIEIPLVDAGPDTFVCGTEINLDATISTGSGSWQPGSGAIISSPTDPHSLATVGASSSNNLYTFVWQEYNWNCPGRDSVDIVFMEVPDATIYWEGPASTPDQFLWQDSTVCGLKDSLLLSAQPVSNPSAIGYWTGLDADFFPNESSPDADVIAGSYGVHKFWWVIDNNEGDFHCIDSSDYPITINFLEIPDANPGGNYNSILDVYTDTACGNEFILSAVPSIDTSALAVDNVYYEWTSTDPLNTTFYNGDIPNDTVYVNILSFDQPQPYYELIWFEDNQWYNTSYGCSDKDTIRVTFAPKPKGFLELVDSIYCLNGEEVISEHAGIRALDDILIKNWAWDLDSGILDPVASGVTQDSIGQGIFYVRWPDSDAKEEHYISLVTTNNYECKSPTMVDTIVEPKAVKVDEVFAPATCGDPNGTIELSPVNGEQINTYLWLDTIFNSSTADHQYDLLPGIYTYRTRAKHERDVPTINYFCVDTFQIEIRDTGYIVADFEVLTDTFGYAEMDVTFSDASFWTWYDPDDSTNFVTNNEVIDESQWRFYKIPRDTDITLLKFPVEIFPWEIPMEFDGEDIIEEGEPTITFTEAGYYKWKYVATSEDGCLDTIVGGYINTDGDSELETTNIFTPNGDGENDVFEFETTTIKTMQGYIFNRWGKKIFEWTWNESDQIPDPGWWDGKLESGNDAPPGVYFYTVKATGQKAGDEFEENGVVHLIREKK